MKKDIKSIVAVPTKVIDVGAQTSTVTSAAVDLKGYRSCLVIIDADAWTDGTHTFSLTECDTSGGTYTAVASTDISGSAPVIDGAPDDDQAYILGYVGSKRFIKVVSTVAGASTGAIYGALVIPGHKINGGKLN